LGLLSGGGVGEHGYEQAGMAYGLNLGRERIFGFVDRKS
jgi:hypothetical protein